MNDIILYDLYLDSTSQENKRISHQHCMSLTHDMSKTLTVGIVEEASSTFFRSTQTNSCSVLLFALCSLFKEENFNARVLYYTIAYSEHPVWIGMIVYP